MGPLNRWIVTIALLIYLVGILTGWFLGTSIKTKAKLATNPFPDAEQTSPAIQD